MISGSRKLLNCEKDQHQRQRERRQKFVAFRAQLAGFTGVLQLVAFRQDFGGFGFQIPQRLIERADGHGADFHGVELLEAVERARAVFLFQRGKGTERHQLVVRSLDINRFELARIQAFEAFELWNHLVTAPGEVEAIHEIATDE
jgi:hypothetical protein